MVLTGIRRRAVDLFDRLSGRKRLRARIVVLEHALMPFAAARVFEQSLSYPAGSPTVIQTPVTRSMCAELQQRYDQAVLDGKPALGERPDPDNGSRNWPHEFLSFDDLIVDHWRRARASLQGHPMLEALIETRAPEAERVSSSVH